MNTRFKKVEIETWGSECWGVVVDIQDVDDEVDSDSLSKPVVVPCRHRHVIPVLFLIVDATSSPRGGAIFHKNNPRSWVNTKPETQMLICVNINFKSCIEYWKFLLTEDLFVIDNVENSYRLTPSPIRP